MKYETPYDRASRKAAETATAEMGETEKGGGEEEMSVIFKTVNMPKNCAECPFWSVCKPMNDDFEDWISIQEAVEDGFLVRHEQCPLAPLQKKHGRLIDADALKEELATAGIISTYGTQIFLKIDAAKTIIEAEGGEEDG